MCSDFTIHSKRTMETACTYPSLFTFAHVKNCLLQLPEISFIRRKVEILSAVLLSVYPSTDNQSSTGEVEKCVRCHDITIENKGDKFFSHL